MSSWFRYALVCRQFRPRLEDRVSGGVLSRDPQLDAHLRACARCREAFDQSTIGTELLRQAGQPAAEPSENFVRRVMAAVREQELSLAAPNSIWRPLEALASRFALVAAMVLLALSLYLAGFAPGTATTMSNQQPEIGAGLPEPPAQPASPDEVLMSLAERANDL